MGRRLEEIQGYATLPSMMIPIDKVYHLIAGFLVYLVCSWFYMPTGAFIVCFIVAMGKEFYDIYLNKRISMSDILFTMIGSVICFLIQLI